jgi:hypothetical protein
MLTRQTEQSSSRLRIADGALGTYSGPRCYHAYSVPLQRPGAQSQPSASHMLGKFTATSLFIILRLFDGNDDSQKGPRLEKSRQSGIFTDDQGPPPAARNASSRILCSGSLPPTAGASASLKARSTGAGFGAVRLGPDVCARTSAAGGEAFTSSTSRNV